MNQDSVYCNENSVGGFQNLFIVADGMGGHKAGDYASKLCVEKMAESIKNSESITPVTTLEEAVKVANNAVLVRLATDKPTTTEEFLAIPGIGSHRCEAYGQLFINAIKKYITNQKDD